MIDWTKLAIESGSISESGEYRGGNFATRALDLIIGEENIRNGVIQFIEGTPGHAVVSDVFRAISSVMALEIAYEEYKKSSGVSAVMAVTLIQDIRNTRSLEWIEEFLQDDNVAVCGVGVLDQLLWYSLVEPEEVEHLIALAERHKIENVRKGAAFIRQYLRDRSRLSRLRRRIGSTSRYRKVNNRF